MRKNFMRTAVVAATVAAIGATGVIVNAGDADAAGLPNGFKKSSGIDGQTVTIKRTGERANPMPSVANNGAGRAAAVSGTYKATLNKGKGHMTVSYLVGCQVDITGLEGGLSGAIGFTSSLSGSISVPLKPGQVAVVTSDAMSITKGKATMMVDGFHIDVQQCGGYASARSMVRVMAADGLSTEDGGLSGNSGFLQTTLYGAPFSLN
ncbi:MAG: MspA family porin [Gordonia sp. (in: high G+C Gram-positive bacteria)]|uniref:MspA family porin n=1 Tax=Gordonia sp. (in: high G+C Gram-positive bacteria) TaxID=84139 RepID=UPI003BB7D668